MWHMYLMEMAWISVLYLYITPEDKISCYCCGFASVDLVGAPDNSIARLITSGIFSLIKSGVPLPRIKACHFVPVLLYSL